MLSLYIRRMKKLRVCIDFRDLNKATPMDGYLMPIADMLVDAAAGHKVISFMDSNAGYNQIFMAEEDSKDRFQVPRRNRFIRVGCDDLWSEECWCNLSKGDELYFP